MYLPEWSQKYKEKYTEIRRINNGFYKYQVAFSYNKEKKKTEKKTIRLLGKITEKDGFIPSSKDQLRQKSEELPQVDIKTYGVHNLFSELMKEEIVSLTEVFDSEATEQLLSFSMMRWAYQTPIKRATYYHSHDFCSEQWATRNMSDKTVSLNLKQFGENREKVVGWMKTLLSDIPENEQNFVLMDSTHSMSVSEHPAINAKGYKIENPIDTHKQKGKRKKKNEKEKTAEQMVYESYKQRNEIEEMFDSYKNYLAADVSYMQNRYVLEGWLFANFIAMIAYYKLYIRLRQAELLSKHSPKDIIELSKAIYKMKIRGQWHRSEITEKIKRLFAKIGIDYLK